MHHWNELCIENAKYKIRNRPLSFGNRSLMHFFSKTFKHLCWSTVEIFWLTCFILLKKDWRKTFDGKNCWLFDIILELSFLAEIVTVKIGLNVFFTEFFNKSLEISENLCPNIIAGLKNKLFATFLWWKLSLKTQLKKNPNSRKYWIIILVFLQFFSSNIGVKGYTHDNYEELLGFLTINQLQENFLCILSKIEQKKHVWLKSTW